MNALRPLALLALGAGLLAACDSLDGPAPPDGSALAWGAGAAGVSGIVYEDSDANGARGANESGIPNVVVYLFDTSRYCQPQTYCLAAQARTDAAGAYAFAVPDGMYAVVIPNDSALPAFNGRLFTNLAYTGGALPNRAVTVGPDATGVDFGFAFRVEQTIADLDRKAIPTRTQDATAWAKAIRQSTTGNPLRTVPGTLLDQYLLRIEGLLLPEPFQFGTVSKPAAALAILERPDSTLLAELYRQLLTAELNVVSGRGSSDAAFNQALLAYGEATAAGAVAAQTAPAAPAATVSAAAGLEEAVALLDAFNRSGGGTSGPR